MSVCWGLQGAFLDHIPHLKRCGVTAYRIVRDSEVLTAIDRLIIPGGESTVMTKFLKEYDMLEPLKRRIGGWHAGMGGVCRGLFCYRKRPMVNRGRWPLCRSRSPGIAYGTPNRK